MTEFGYVNIVVEPFENRDFCTKNFSQFNSRQNQYASKLCSGLETLLYSQLPSVLAVYSFKVSRPQLRIYPGFPKSSRNKMAS